MPKRLTFLLPLLVAACGGLPGWDRDRVAEAIPPFLAGCAGLRDPGPLAAPCAEAARLPAGDDRAARAFLTRHFTPVPAGEGLITGYYEPLLRVSPVPAPGFTAPLLAPSPGAPDLDRAGLEAAVASGSWPGEVLAWADPVDAFFLQIQGSGRAVFPDGSQRRLGYGGKNGHPYVPVGRLLIEQGALTREAVSMQSIRAWLRDAPPEAAKALMDANPSWVFFRWRDDLPLAGGPAGTLGVPLTPGRSVAVDRTHTPLGSPVWIATRDPLTGARLERLVIAMDTGGAIRGPARADLFWGWDETAPAAAGWMREPGQVWVMRPKAVPGS